MSERAARALCVETLAKVGIPDPVSRFRTFPHQLSGGMRQRVAIAIALLHRPALIIADEPTTALDVSVQAQIIHEMRGLVRDSGTAMIWITHDLATVSSLADHILVMYAGQVVEAGPTRTILKTPHHPYTRGLLDSVPSRNPRGVELPQIAGSTPSLLDLPKGCPFAPRCHAASPACEVAPPAEVAEGREIRCHHPQGLEA
jgi:peptide/nickel transport system ATP-binding protein